MKKLLSLVFVSAIAGALLLSSHTASSQSQHHEREHSVVILLSESYNDQAYIYAASVAGPCPEIKVGQTTAQAVKALLDAGFASDGGDWFSKMYTR